jgi:hypothetical protein
VRVIHLTEGNLSGAPFRLAAVERAAGIDALMLYHRNDADANDYPCDLLTREPRDRLAPLLAGADLIHFHNCWRDSPTFAIHPWIWEIIGDKPAVFQVHSPRNGDPVFEAALREPALTKLVIAQYHVRQYPECQPVPNAVPIDDPLHRPLFVDNEPPVVAFTPPNCHRSGWHDKGCAATLQVLRQGFRHLVKTGAMWSEVMRERARCDIAIDEIVTGSYHMCSLESLSQGLATIAGLDELTVDALEEVTGTRRHPWIVANPATLHRELTRLVEDAAYRQAQRQAARQYMETFWHPRVIAARFAAIYDGVLQRCGA